MELTVKRGLLTLVDKALLEDFVELSEPVDVMLGDGKILNAVGSGVVTVHTNLAHGKQQECKLHNVLFVPNLSYNLLSVLKVAEAGKSVTFSETTCNISHSDGEIIAIAKKVAIGCLYYLDFQPIVECSSAVNEEIEPSNEVLWHQRYGHLSPQSLKKLPMRRTIWNTVMHVYKESYTVVHFQVVEQRELVNHLA